jgi:hypothetical protein
VALKFFRNNIISFRRGVLLASLVVLIVRVVVLLGSLKAISTAGKDVGVLAAKSPVLLERGCKAETGFLGVDLYCDIVQLEGLTGDT